MAGKSVLSASLVQHLEESGSSVFFYFCSFSNVATGTSSYLLRSLVAQIVQRHQDTAVYVADHYMTAYRSASRKALASLLPELLSIVGMVRLIIDGLDEWDPKEQQIILDDILPLTKVNQSLSACKLLIASRDMPTISRVMHRKKKAAMIISLREEHTFIDRSIESLIANKLGEYQGIFQDLDPRGSTLSQIRRLLLEKSNGITLCFRFCVDIAY
jgi:hypothetical protein